MGMLTFAPERVRVMTNPARVVSQGFKWIVYCGACEQPRKAGLESLFWGASLGGTNDWNLAITFAAAHARQHEPCGECGRTKPTPAQPDPGAAEGVSS